MHLVFKDTQKASFLTSRLDVQLVTRRCPGEFNNTRNGSHFEQWPQILPQKFRCGKTVINSKCLKMLPFLGQLCHIVIGDSAWKVDFPCPMIFGTLHRFPRRFEEKGTFSPGAIHSHGNQLVERVIEMWNFVILLCKMFPEAGGRIAVTHLTRKEVRYLGG